MQIRLVASIGCGLDFDKGQATPFDLSGAIGGV
jgi:hypothetical protein